MLANVLKSDVAVRASIQVVRAFVRLRQFLATNEQLARKIEALAEKVDKHDNELQEVLRILRALPEPPPIGPKRPIGFLPPKSEKRGLREEAPPAKVPDNYSADGRLYAMYSPE
jgi:hypothetical protein